MNIKTIAVIGLLSLMASPITSLSAGTVVRWSNPDQYQDIREGKNHKDEFRKDTLLTLSKHFESLAKSLPEGQILDIQVIDLDLAGEVKRQGQNKVRYYNHIYSPSIKISYQLLDAEMNIVKEDSAVLKDSNFLYNSNRRHLRLDPLMYEKRMIEKWYNRNFS